LRRCDVVYITNHAPFAEELEKLYVRRADSVESAISAALQKHGPDARIAVIPEGPYVLPALA
ncbi:MAG: hypothetical protein AAF907_15180, partial [Planctomycetota bacterium]